MKTNAMDPKLGFKETGAGWIPQDWGVQNVQELATICTGNKDTKDNVPDGQYPFFVRSQTLKKINSFSYDGVAVLTAGDGVGTGKVFHLVHGKFDYHQRVYKISDFSKGVHPRFFFEYFRKNFIRQVRRYSAKNSVDSVRREMISCMAIPLPPFIEQEAIADVFECWDKAIRNYALKIEKKRNAKKGLMQRLLSGKQRLPGFEGEWGNYRFGSLFTFIKTYAFSRAELTSNRSESQGILNLHYGDIHSAFHNAVLNCETELRIPFLRQSTPVPTNLTQLRDGDLVIADASEDYKGVGACVELKGVSNLIITGGLHTFVARDSEGLTAMGYRGYLFTERTVVKTLMRIATGVSVHGISKGNLATINLFLPPVEEQKAIAKVLSAADAEIEALQKKLAALKEQKRYLLNNMVIGAIRLPQFVNQGAKA